MKCYIEHDHVTDAVKVWLFRLEQEGVVYMWPMGYPDEKSKCMTWTQLLVPEHQARPDDVRPALEMAGWMWRPFVEAIRAEDGEAPAGKLLHQALQREQNRVDALIGALLKQVEPQVIFTSKGEIDG